MVVHVKMPKWKSYDQGFFNWIKITDFLIVIYCFLEWFRNSLEMTPKTINYYKKICNFDPIKKALVIWFSFGPFYMHKHQFTWIYCWFLLFNYFLECIIPMRGEGDVHKPRAQFFQKFDPPLPLSWTNVDILITPLNNHVDIFITPPHFLNFFSDIFPQKRLFFKKTLFTKKW